MSYLIPLLKKYKGGLITEIEKNLTVKDVKPSTSTKPNPYKIGEPIMGSMAYKHKMAKLLALSKKIDKEREKKVRKRKII